MGWRGRSGRMAMYAAFPMFLPPAGAAELPDRKRGPVARGCVPVDGVTLVHRAIWPASQYRALLELMFKPGLCRLDPATRWRRTLRVAVVSIEMWGRWLVQP